MHRTSICRLLCIGGFAWVGLIGEAAAQTPVPATQQAPVAPKDAASGATPAPVTQAPVAPKTAPGNTTPAPAAPEPKPQAPTPTPTPSTPGTPGAPTPSGPLAPSGRPQTYEYEPNASPTTPRLATTETVDVPARPVVLVKGESSFDDAFKAIKTALDKAKAALAKAGLTQTGHPLAIITDTDANGIKFEAALPIAAKPTGEDGKDGKTDLGDGVTIGDSPAGPALKFRHRGPYDEIDRTYSTITSYLDNKGLEATSPFIEEYPDDMKSDDDPRLAVDIYIFIKK